MAGKHVVTFLTPPEIYKRMFRIQDLDRLHQEVTVRGPLPASASVDDYKQLLADATVAITGWGTSRFSAPLLTAAPRLKLIAHSAGSVKSLVDDLVYDRGIRVTTAAHVNAVPVAHYTIAMMVSLLKQIPWISTAYARGEIDEVRRRRVWIRELEDLEIGLIGASRVGREVVKLLANYPNLTLKCYDPYLPAAEAKKLGVELVSLEDACRCPVVSIHAPSIPETRHMFNTRLLGLLPDGCVLINTSRGSLVDEDALVAEVKRRPLFVALDVTDPEPPRQDSALRTTPNIILTPHVAGAMNQACRNMGAAAIDQALNLVRGHPLEFEVTRQMLPTQA